MTESAAIRLASHGDPTAFAELYRLHQPLVYARCRELLGNDEDAEDATQEVFLQVFRKLRRYAFQSAFSTWLYSVATNRALMTMRSRRSQPVFVSTGESEDANGRLDRDWPPVPDPRLSTLDRLVLAEHLSRLNRIAHEHRTIGHLRYSEGLSLAEIADRFHISISAAKTRSYRARLAILKALA